MKFPELEGIDHAHVQVSNREQALEWYRDTLGFEVTEALRSWAVGAGPLTIEDASGRIHLALFERNPAEPQSALAFGASAAGFLNWRDQLQEMGLSIRCTDHTLAWSLYFSDPWGNGFEITTYDHAEVTAALN